MKKSIPRILIIEDEISLRKSLTKLIELRSLRVESADNFISALKKIRYNHYDIFLLDIKLPDGNGIQLLKKYKSKMEFKTIIMTAHATIPSVVDAIKNGAFYYLEKPLDEELLFIQMEKILELTQLKEDNQSLKRELTTQHTSDDIIYESKQMAEVISIAKKFARTDDSVLIEGNTGVGKEIMAKFIHNRSKRKDKVFLPVNCSSFPEQLFESEFFGFKKGAFTGAYENYSGRFIQADKGTLFLDEIGEIPQHLQAKLLRVLEDEIIYQLGNNQPRRVDVRIIAATNKDLWEEVQTKQFRKDLYFRLKGTMIHIPPLSERKDDIMPLIWHFISIFNNLLGKKINHITQEAESYLKEYSWEGNVRELKNTIKSIFSIIGTDTITMKELLLTLKSNHNEIKKDHITLQEHELNYIKEVLNANHNNIKKTAQILGISRTRLYRKIELLKT